jgi:BCD family chlorophyll transporter-like MFS transporter
LLRDALIKADLGPVLGGPGTGYAAVYLLEILLLLAMLIAVGPLVGRVARENGNAPVPFGLIEFPT